MYYSLTHIFAETREGIKMISIITNLRIKKQISIAKEQHGLKIFTLNIFKRRKLLYVSHEIFAVIIQRKYVRMDMFTNF